MLERSNILQEIKNRILNGVDATDSNPSHVAAILHYRGCSRALSLEVVASEDEVLGFVAQRGVRGGIIEQCPECGAKGEIV